MAQLMLLTRGTGGDVFPFVRIGAALKRRGHEVVLLSYSGFQGVADQAGLAFVPFDPFMPYADWLAQQGLKESAAAQGQFMVLDFVEAHKTIEKHYAPEGALLLGHSNLHATVLMAAERLGAQYVPVFMAPFFSKVMGATMKAYAAHGRYLDAARAAIGLPPVSDWAAYLTARRRGLGIWPDWYDPADETEIFDVVRMGFLRNEEVERGELPAELQAFLDRGEPPVLITHGSSKPKDGRFFDAAVEACRLVGLRGVVADPYFDDARCRQTGQARYFRHVPFARVLPHVRAMIHHGGIGTLGLCLTYGVPQVVMALGFDRPDNGVRLKGLGVAEYLPAYEWRPEVIAESLRAALSPAVRERCRSYCGRVGGDASLAACEFLESLAGERQLRAARS